jgi:hypothetical protein
MHIVRVWTKEAKYGTELADVRIDGVALTAGGVAIGADPEPYRLDYQLTTGDRFVTVQLVARTEGKDWRRTLDLKRAASGDWSCTVEAEGNLDLPGPGGEMAALAGGLDCDLGLSPLTNSMPVLRHHLHEGGGPVEFLMAWVSVPDLAVYPSRQRYTFVRRAAAACVVRFEDLGNGFVSEICLDDDGVVIDYPQLARRLA